MAVMRADMCANAQRTNVNAHEICGRRGNHRERRDGQNTRDQSGFNCLRHCSSPGVVLCSGVKNGTLPGFVP